MKVPANKTAREKILSFTHYLRGWHYGEGKPFSNETIRRALYLNRVIIAKSTPDTDAFPGSDGDIMVTAYLGTWYWEFLIDPSGTVTYRSERDDIELDEKEGLRFEEAVGLARRLAKQTWMSYAYSTQTDTIQENSDSTVWPLSPPGYSNQGFQLLTPTALGMSAIHRVHTYDSTTLNQPVTLQSFGSSTPLYCLSSV